MEPEGSLACTQEPSTGPYPEPDKSSKYPHSIYPRSSLIHLRLERPNGLFPSGFSTDDLHAFLVSPFLLRALPISSSLSWPI
jgi:hypothetical protein